MCANSPEKSKQDNERYKQGFCMGSKRLGQDMIFGECFNVSDHEAGADDVQVLH